MCQGEKKQQERPPSGVRAGVDGAVVTADGLAE
jgi:hypothetical protein